MSYNYQLSEEAESDIEQGYLWYESKQEGLGEAFLESLDKAKKAIVSNPTTYRLRYKERVRGFVIKSFPYLILYIVAGRNIDVISVFNTNQDPSKWKRRVSS